MGLVVGVSVTVIGEITVTSTELETESGTPTFEQVIVNFTTDWVE